MSGTLDQHESELYRLVSLVAYGEAPAEALVLASRRLETAAAREATRLSERLDAALAAVREATRRG